MIALLSIMIALWVATIIAGINSMVISDRHSSGLLKDGYWGNTYSVDYATDQQKKVRTNDLKKSNKMLIKLTIAATIVSIVYAALAV